YRDPLAGGAVLPHHPAPDRDVLTALAATQAIRPLRISMVYGLSRTIPRWCKAADGRGGVARRRGLMSGSWLASAPHREWLAGEADRLVEFASRSVHPDGGFAWQDDDGTPLLDRPVEL